MLADGEWWNAVWNTLKFAVISVTLETLLGLIVALTSTCPSGTRPGSGRRC